MNCAASGSASGMTPAPPMVDSGGSGTSATATDPLTPYNFHIPNKPTHIMLKGTELLNAIAAMPEGTTRTEQCRACGYEIDGRLHFTDFFTAILEAKGQLKTEDQRNDELIQQYPEQKEILEELLEDYDSEAIEEFIEYFGEENLESFTDAYQGEMSGAEFAEQLVTDCYCLDIPAFVCIDWEQTWEELRYDFTELSGHIFAQNF